MIVVGSDHGGLLLKDPVIEILDELKIPYRYIGTDNTESTDYPMWGSKAAKMVSSGECEKGIIICGTGAGISMAANKVKGIRCVVCSDVYTAKLSRAHNDANMLALGGRVVGPDLAKMLVQTWLETPFDGGERHKRRVQMIMDIEKG